MAGGMHPPPRPSWEPSHAYAVPMDHAAYPSDAQNPPALAHPSPRRKLSNSLYGSGLPVADPPARPAAVPQAAPLKSDYSHLQNAGPNAAHATPPPANPVDAGPRHVRKSAAMQPTWIGFVNTTEDSLLLLEACLQGLLNHCPRRPHDRERAEIIRSGSIFVYEENASGIKRWTDGLTWSPSRILGNYLVYRELSAPFPPGEKKRATKKRKASNLGAGESAAQAAQAAQPANPYAANNMADAATSGMHLPDPLQQADAVGALPRNPYVAGATEVMHPDEDRMFHGSLTDSYQFKEDGLVKRTLCVPFRGCVHHIVCYYKAAHVKAGVIHTPSEDSNLKNLTIRPDLIVACQNNKMVLDGRLAMPDVQQVYYSPISAQYPGGMPAGYDAVHPQYPQYGVNVQPHGSISYHTTPHSQTLPVRTAQSMPDLQFRQHRAPSSAGSAQSPVSGPSPRFNQSYPSAISRHLIGDAGFGPSQPRGSIGHRDQSDQMGYGPDAYKGPLQAGGSISVPSQNVSPLHDPRREAWGQANHFAPATTQEYSTTSPGFVAPAGPSYTASTAQAYGTTYVSSTGPSFGNTFATAQDPNFASPTSYEHMGGAPAHHMPSERPSSECAEADSYVPSAFKPGFTMAQPHGAGANLMTHPPNEMDPLDQYADNSVSAMAPYTHSQFAI